MNTLRLPKERLRQALDESNQKLASESETALGVCSQRIGAANDQFGKSFQDWILVVGSNLETAQKLLSANGSHRSYFGKWVKDEFGWTPRHAHRLIAAEKIVSLLRPIGRGTPLPNNESQCRALANVPEDDLLEVWTKVCEHAGAENEPITAKLIRKIAEPYCKSLDNVAEFDIAARVETLDHWLRARLNEWPTEHRRIAAAAIRRTLEELKL